MEIKLAREMGMCFGVKMTLDHIAEAGQQHANIDTLGTLVHNPQLVERLAEQGVQVKDGLDQVQAPTVAITAHGAAPDIAARAQAAGRTVIDTHFRGGHEPQCDVAFDADAKRFVALLLETFKKGA